MKKKILSILAIFVVAILSAVSLVACNKGGGDKAKSDNISRMTKSYYAGESELFAVSVECGRREKTFIADGKCCDVVDFQEISITPLTKNNYETISFELVSTGNTLSGVVSPKGNGEFKAELTLNFVPTLVNLKVGDKSSTVELQNLLAEAKSIDEIVKIASTEFAERIAKESVNGVLTREIYIKLISGDRTNYYFYVSYIGAGTDYWAMLIDPVTGAVISKR